MPERAVITQGVQIGVESTPGTPVAANKVLNSLDINPELHFDTQMFKPTGQKFNSIVVPTKEWSEASCSGPVSYSEIIYILSSLLTQVTPAQQAATTAYAWAFSPASRAADTVKTYTIEQGNANRAQKLAYAVFSEAAFTFNRGGATMEAKLFGQAITDGITLTASPSSVEEKPVIPNQVDVYVDATSAGIGTTKMLRVLETKINITNRFGPIWVLNSSLGSFASHVELNPTVTVEMQVEADAQGMAFLNTFRAGTSQYVRVKATSPDFAGTAIPYSLAFDIACKVGSVSSYSDQEGVYAITWTNQAVYDPAWNSGQTILVTAINKQTTL